jgi:S1-C subfamily serine protease
MLLAFLQKQHQVIELFVTGMKKGSKMHTVLLCSCMVLCLVFTWPRGTAQAASPEQIFARAAPSVVVVEVMNEQGTPLAQGSGVITGPGLVITPCHVVQAGRRVRIWHKETPFAATLGYADPQRDLCQLHTPQLQASAVPRGTIKTLAVGQPVYIISAPHGLTLTFTSGMISALRPALGSFLIQTDAAVSPGSSGGGLFDRTGRLIGMPCFQLQEGQHLNFALPIDWIAEVALQPMRSMETRPSPDTIPADWAQHPTTPHPARKWLGLTRPGGPD